MVKVGAAQGAARTKVKGPADRVHNLARLVLAWVHIPDFFKANPVMLGVAIGREFELQSVACRDGWF